MATKSILLALLAASGTALGQSTVHVPDADPSSMPCNGIPFGIYDHPRYPYPRELKYQTLITPAQYGSFNPTLIRELAFASCAKGIQSFGHIVVRIDQTTATNLDTTFARNLTASAVTVLDADDFLWHLEKDAWVRIGLERGFPFTPGKSIVIDIEVRGARFLAPDFGPSAKVIGGFHNAGNIQRLYALDWKNTPPAQGTPSLAGLKIQLSSELGALGTFGVGCPGNGKLAPVLLLQGSPRIGNTTHVLLTHARPGYPAILALDVSGTLAYAPVVLAGFSGCRVYVVPALSVLAVTDVQGDASVALPLPVSTALLNRSVFGQYFQAELQPAAIRSTNFGRILIGR